jgi:hypothetical protein
MNQRPNRNPVINFQAIKVIYKYEMLRAWETLLQSFASPVISTALYFVVFGSAIGSRIQTIEGVPYGTFIVPGLMMLALLTQSISNAAFGIYFPKFTGTIYEVLSAPVSFFEILLGYVGAAATKSLIIGLIILATADRGLCGGFNTNLVRRARADASGGAPGGPCRAPPDHRPAVLDDAPAARIACALYQILHLNSRARVNNPLICHRGRVVDLGAKHNRGMAECCSSNWEHQVAHTSRPSRPEAGPVSLGTVTSYQPSIADDCPGCATRPGRASGLARSPTQER